MKKNEKSERPSVKAVVLRDYGNAMLSAGNNQKAIDLYKLSLQQWHTTENKPEEARTAVLLAACYSEKGKKEEAIHYYKTAFEIWQKLGEQNEMNKIKTLLDNLEK